CSDIEIGEERLNLCLHSCTVRPAAAGIHASVQDQKVTISPIDRPPVLTTQTLPQILQHHINTVTAFCQSFLSL
ncbi:hypothetical protein L9F63_006630, partial [Diploptera punctata]